MTVSKKNLGLVLFTMVLFIASSGYTQSKTQSDEVKVTLEIISKGITTYYKEKQEGYFIKASLSNIQDTTISFVIMSCSWPGDNWVSNDISIYMTDRECDGNSPTRILLEPKQTMSFYGFIKDQDQKLAGKRFKLAFLYYDNFNALLDHSQSGKTIIELKKYWSNEVKLEDNLFKYRIDNKY